MPDYFPDKRLGLGRADLWGAAESSNSARLRDAGRYAGDAGRTTRLCALIDGLGKSVALGDPWMTRSRILGICAGLIEAALEAADGRWASAGIRGLFVCVDGLIAGVVALIVISEGAAWP